LAVLLLLPLPHPLQAQEQAPIVVTATSVHYSFGQQATFSIAVSADAGIHALYLYLQKEGDTRIDVAAVPFEGGTSVQASAQLDLRHHSLPPFGDVAWWWEVRDAIGNTLTTEPSVFQYVDNRFEWRTVSAGPVRLYTVVDDALYTQAALDIAQTSLVQIAQALGSAPPDEVKLYIYPSLADLRAALEMGGREWMGG